MKLKCHFSWQAQYLVKCKCHFSWQAQYLVKFKSLFVAGAVFGEIWNDSRSAKCCIFQYKMLVVGVKGNLGCEAGCGLTVSWSDHGRIMVGSCSDHARTMLGSFSDPGRIGRALEMTFHPFSANFFEIRDGHFSWQAQYLVSLDYDACCSAHCK